MKITINDVANKAGVSNATVSRVLSNQKNVSEAIRIKVLMAADELHYQPNGIARKFRINRSSIIGLVVSDILNPFYTSLVRSIEDVAFRNGIAVFLFNTDENEHKEKIYIDYMLEERVAGVILAPVSEENLAVNRLLDAGIPVVCLDRRVPGEIDTVMVDNFTGAYQAIEHLLRMGHCRIGAILGAHTTTGRQREEGYRSAFFDHSIPYHPEYVQRGLPREREGKEMMKHLLALQEPPSAIFCGNNLLTIGALAQIHAQGMRVPDDIAVAGFDDLEWYSVVEPSITAVYQPVQEMGIKAIDLLFQRIAGDQFDTKTILLNTELRVRQSSGGLIKRGV